MLLREAIKVGRIKMKTVNLKKVDDRKIFIIYVISVIIFFVSFLPALIQKLPTRYADYSPVFIFALVGFYIALLFSPFLIVGLLGFYKKKYLLSSIAISSMLLMIVASSSGILGLLPINNGQLLILRWLLSLLLGGFLVSYYKFPRNYIWLCVLFSPLAIFYYLVRGIYKQMIG